MRNYDRESEDNIDRKYIYDFDLICREFLLKRFNKYFLETEELDSLEIGSYDGSMTELILNYIKKIDVLEPSNKMVKILNTKFKNKLKVYEGTIENFKIDKLYKNIFLIHTLEHVDDPIVTLNKIWEILSPGGFLFVAVPNGNAISRQIAVKMNIIKYLSAVTTGEESQGHLRTYTLDTFLYDLKSSKFRVIDYGGVIFKALANFQLDKALTAGIINEQYLLAADELALEYPNFSATIYAVCQK